MTTLQFEDVRPAKPDLDALARHASATRERIASARDVDDALAALREWDAARRDVDSYQALVSLRFHQDTRDPEWRRAREEWDAAEPRWTELEVAVARALLDHPLRGAIEARVGPQLFALWSSEALAFDPVIADDLVVEARLGAEYTELLASAEIEFEGQKENLSTLPRFRQDPDRERRHAAELALWGWFGANRPTLDRIFSDLVALRTRMAKKLGYGDFVELGYRRMCRVDYDKADVERLRAAIRESIVPLANEIVARQRAELGVERLMAWDEAVHDKRGNPKPKGDLGWMVERTREVFDGLGPELGGFFRKLDAGGFHDLASRPGKAGGGFCTSFPTHGMPFVFANFNGTKGDVEVLTHELGHAFQCWSSRDQWPSDYIWPTFEAAEIHSMGLELLTFPAMEAWFGDDAARFRRTHLTESLLFLPYGTAVDHFQHALYEEPLRTAEERHALWKELERTYMPWRDWGDLEHPAMGGRWQGQRHIYLSPFYYVDYVLAQLCALQLWSRAEEDRDGAMAAYLALCKRGGSLPFRGLVASAGLESPFEPGCVASVAGRVRAALDL